ncbi:hypothetical protein DOTSEDRAFT_90531 [Dothistroma septosporum NZE10]|uniref:Uncharacterized protein n=1 Tax=Dothistroma septosporum (strain NZE10 / CBS 128990) TaxID=675120 RepID=N1PKF9_DOTSN|nr:hypothetical protein DOTSEDRAFT_90531 [Dothistroma septosporum NZE10]
MTGKHDQAVYPSAELNPLLFTKSDYLFDDHIVPSHVEEAFEIFRFRGRAPWMDHPQGSWRKMFASQPPLEEFWYHWCFGDDLNYDEVTQDTPVTLADFERRFASPDHIDVDEYYAHYTSHFFSTSIGSILFSAPSERKTWRIIERDGERFVQLAEGSPEMPAVRPCWT